MKTEESDKSLHSHWHTGYSSYCKCTRHQPGLLIPSARRGSGEMSPEDNASHSSVNPRWTNLADTRILFHFVSLPAYR